MYTRRNMCIKKERNNTCETKVKKNIHHLIYIYIYISKNTMYVKSGHKAMVHVMRKEYNKTSLHP